MRRTDKERGVETKKIAVKRATEMALATVALAVLFAGQLVADEGARVFDVPKLDGIVIDGTADDWKEAGFHVDVMTSVDGWVRPVSNPARSLRTRIADGRRFFTCTVLAIAVNRCRRSSAPLPYGARAS
jgi:hypothetical protein